MRIALDELETDFCLEALDEALTKARPEIFNTDQGCQFTSMSFTQRLIAENVSACAAPRRVFGAALQASAEVLAGPPVDRNGRGPQ